MKMKKGNIGKVLIGVLLLICLVFVACDMGNNNEPGKYNNMINFEGVWRNPYGNHPVYTFNGNRYYHSNVFGFLSEGTFSFTDDVITFIPESGLWTQTWSQNYTLSNDVLNLVGNGQNNYGLFRKNYELEKTKFEGIWKNSALYEGNEIFITFLYDCYSVSVGEYYDTGYFTFDDTSITFNNYNYERKWKNDEYILTDTTLSLSEPTIYSGSRWWGSFTKQPE